MRARWASTTIWSFHCFAYLQRGSAALLQRAETLPSPISFPPAQNWDGPDGPWSTFTLRVGTPAQNVRVLISTASQATWVVVPEGCGQDDTSCQGERGATFDYNTSSTWTKQGYYDLFYEKNLGLSGSGLWGNDTLGLGIQGSGGPTLNNQIVTGITTDNFYVGMFGVNPKSTNYTGFENQQDSYVASLKKQNFIPSTSFGYTAGAQYRLKKVLGSLTLGGYDESRFTPNSHSFTFAPDNDRDLMVGIQSISFSDPNGTTKSLLPEGILSYIDSTIPYIYLPLEACKAFEKAFGLEYNATTELYPVSNALHSDLKAQNASVTFTLGDTVTGGDTVNITLPYDSFDLTATFPVVEDNTRYFPLKRAANDSQFTLGRTFLQEAYLTVDYERNNFSISQCLFEDGLQQKLVGIPPVVSSSSSNSTAPGGDKPTSKHNGVVVGAAVGVSVLAIAIIGSGIVYFLIKKRRAKRREEDKQEEAAKADAEAAERVRLGFDKAELGTSDQARYEMGAPLPGAGIPRLVKEKSDFLEEHARKHELLAGGADYAELGDRKGDCKGPVYEMYDCSTAPVELPADMPGELPAAYPSRRASALTPSFRSARQTPPPRSSATSPFSDAAEYDSRSPVSPNTNPSPVDRRLGQSPPTRSSTLNSNPFVPSLPCRSGPSSPTDRSLQSASPSEGIFSPVSPFQGSELSPSDHRPSPSSPATPPLPTPSPGGSSRGRRSPHIAALRSDDSRKRERRRRDDQF